jgi:CheY-like chemotaxis protein
VDKMQIKKILIVDDDNIANYVTRSTIERTKCADEIIVKTDGRDALLYLQEDYKKTNRCPSLILLDLKMPGMDGFEFIKEFEISCKNIKNETVVIILSENCSGEDIIKLRQLGNYTFVNKPLNVDKLIDIYHKYFRNRFSYNFQQSLYRFSNRFGENKLKS